MMRVVLKIPPERLAKRSLAPLFKGLATGIVLIAAIPLAHVIGIAGLNSADMYADSMRQLERDVYLRVLAADKLTGEFRACVAGRVMAGALYQTLADYPDMVRARVKGEYNPRDDFSFYQRVTIYTRALNMCGAHERPV